MTKKHVIAIDGPAGSGKSTVARQVALSLGATLLDTGAIYRSVALVARQSQVDWADESALAALAGELPIRFSLTSQGNRVFLGEQDVSDAIRTPEISRGASQVSAHPAVRRALLELQRQFGEGQTLVVAEGRDMGTVVFPDALVKVFLVADPRVRAQRRQAELAAKGQKVSVDQVLKEQNQRDEADQSRQTAPLKAAEDAHVVDTSPLSVEQVVQTIVRLVPAEG